MREGATAGRASTRSRLPVPVRPGIEIVGVRPHTALRFSRLLLHVYVAVTIGGDGVPFLYQPFRDVAAVAGYGAEEASKMVCAVDMHADVLAANFLDQRALHTPPVVEPVTVPMPGHLVPFGSIDPGEAYFMSGDPDPVSIGHVRLPGERLGERVGVG